MKGNDPLIEVLTRNHDLIVGARVLILGEINSPQLMQLLAPTQSAVVLCDHYGAACAMAAVMGKRLGTSSFETACYKHIKVIFAAASDERILEEIGPLDRVVVFVSKTKSLNQHTLFALQRKFQHEGTPAQITLIGSNDGGGKSADKLVSAVADVYKHDSARKCTVFNGTFRHYDENQGVGLTDCKRLSAVTVGALTLEQEPGLFSQGELDGGSALLLKALSADLAGPESISGPILDLGCGSGVLGLTLAAQGYGPILCTDISATALYATEHNAQRHGLSIHTLACDMLPAPELLTQLAQPKFQLIVTNPPFHQGIARSLKETQAMIAAAPHSLTTDGALYLVGNTCLNYGADLKAAFAQVKELIATPKFTVYKATLR